MYVSSPYRAEAGTTTVLVTQNVRMTSTDISNTEGEAIAKKDNFTYAFARLSRVSRRELMSSGRTGYKSFNNTSYKAYYRNSRANGHVYRLKVGTTSYNNGKFLCEAIPFGIGWTGEFNTSGYNDESVYLDPYGSSLHVIALANRAVIWNNINQCEAEAKLKLLRDQFDMAEFLSGLPDTVRMIAEQTMRFIYAWRNVRNGNFRVAAKFLGITRKNLNFKTASSAWLEFQYGWKPILSDIVGGMAYVNKLLNEPGPHVKVTRRTFKTLTYRKLEPNTVWLDTSCKTEAWTSCEVKFKGRISEPNIALLNSLALLNPAYSAWVSTPFSFVIDWMIPVGNWLQALTSSLGLDFISGYRTMRTHGTISATVTKPGLNRDPPSIAVYKRDFGSASCNIGVAWIDRFKYSAWPIPKLYFRFPFSSNERIASAIALTRSTVRLRG